MGKKLSFFFSPCRSLRLGNVFFLADTLRQRWWLLKELEKILIIIIYFFEFLLATLEKNMIIARFCFELKINLRFYTIKFRLRLNFIVLNLRFIFNSKQNLAIILFFSRIMPIKMQKSILSL